MIIPPIDPGDPWVKVGIQVAAEIIKKITLGVLDWSKSHRRPGKEKIEEKAIEIAEKHVPLEVTGEDREKLVASLSRFAMPTLEEIIEFNPVASEVRSKIRHGGIKKSAAKKSPAKKGSRRRAPAKKAARKSAKKR